MHTTPVNIEPVSATLDYLQSALHKPVTYMLAPPGGHAWETGQYASMPVTIRDGRGRVRRARARPRRLPACAARRARCLRLTSARPSSASTTPRWKNWRAPSRREPGHRVRSSGAPARAGHAVAVRRARRPASERRHARALRLHAGVGAAQAGTGNGSARGRAGLAPRHPQPVAHDAPAGAGCAAGRVRYAHRGGPADLVAADIVYPTAPARSSKCCTTPPTPGPIFTACSSTRCCCSSSTIRPTACHAITPHAAFAHPATPPETPPRESIEIRCLLIFD
jgi:hypothetical protein